MAAQQDLEAALSHLLMSSATNDSPDELMMARRQSSVSSEDSWQSTSSIRTPASSLYSEDFEQETKARQKSTVIHEEAENPPSDSPNDTAIAAKSQYNEASPATPPESPILPPADLLANQPKRVLQAVEYDLPYTHPTMPWDKFYSSRADYPDSMFEGFLQYHHGPMNVLHDLGAGSGLAADGLLSALLRSQPRNISPKKLPRIILSDPGEENLGITARFVQARHADVAMECWQARGEDQDQFLAPASVDMYVPAET